MKRNLLLPFLFTFIFAFAQKSKLYDDHGRLFADSTLQISKKQLKKFVTIEDDFTDAFRKRLEYPAVHRENEIDFEVILSFNINDCGQYNDVIIEKATWHSGQPMPTEKYFTGFITAQMLKATGKFNERFKAKKGKREKYYMPLKFKMDKDANFTGIVSGWIVKKQKIIPPDYNDRRYN